MISAMTVNMYRPGMHVDMGAVPVNPAAAQANTAATAPVTPPDFTQQ